MRKLYNEFFYIPKYGKVREKAMLTRLTMTIAVVIMCLAVMGITAYAYFSHNITSSFNMIKAANFDLTVSVAVTNNETTDTVTATTDNTYTLTSGTYTVSLKKTGTAKTGFCIVEITVGEAKTTLHTQQLGKDGEVERGELTFTLNVSGLSEPATVSFVPHWGTSVYYRGDENSRYIEDAFAIDVSAEGVFFATGNPQKEEAPQTPSDPEQTELIHTVEEGENLTWIANAYNTTPEAIAKYNDLKDMRVIQIRQQLKIPPSDWTEPEDTTEQTTVTETTDAFTTNANS